MILEHALNEIRVDRVPTADDRHRLSLSRGYGGPWDAEGISIAELSWTLEDNSAVNKFAASLVGRVTKKYRIYEKRIG